MVNYGDIDYSQGYGQTEEASKALAKGDILNQYKLDHDFRSTVGNASGEATNDIGYNLYGFDIRYQKNFESAQPSEVEPKFSEKFPVGLYGYALVLTNKLVHISSDGHKTLIWFKWFLVFHNNIIFFHC